MLYQNWKKATKRNSYRYEVFSWKVYQGSQMRYQGNSYFKAVCNLCWYQLTFRGGTRLRDYTIHQSH